MHLVAHPHGCLDPLILFGERKGKVHRKVSRRLAIAMSLRGELEKGGARVGDRHQRPSLCDSGRKESLAEYLVGTNPLLVWYILLGFRV